MPKNLSDKEFLARLEKVGGKKKLLAKELGVGPSAISNRLKRIKENPTKDLDLSPGRTAVVLAAELMKEDPKYREGVVSAGRDLRALQRLEGLLTHIETQIDNVADKLKESKRPNTVFIKTLTSLVREGRGLITDSFAIKKDLFNIKAIGDFMEAVIRIMEKYDPDVQRKLYEELSRFGLEGQVDGGDEGEA